MTSKVDDLLKQALRLDEKDRASLAGALLESLHGSEPGLEADWAEIIRRRVDELDRGTVTTVPWSEVKERLFRDFG